MRPDDPNYEYLFLIADALGDLRSDVVFVGGCTAGLLLTDLAAEGIRATKDVDRVEIRTISAPAFVATKLEAFMDRGHGDFLSSHDLEDVLAVVDGRPSIVEELQMASPDLRQFVRETIRVLLSEPRFEDYLPGRI